MAKSSALIKGKKEHQSYFLWEGDSRRYHGMVEEMSSLLSKLNDGRLDLLPRQAFIDLTARLNRQRQILEDMTEKFKDKIKDENKFVVQGDNYEAVVNSTEKTIIVPDLVRGLLDKKQLKKVSRTTQEISVSFRVRG